MHAIHELLRDGDCYQVNLTRRLTFDAAPDPLALFSALAHQNPAPHAGVCAFGDRTAVVSGSRTLRLCREYGVSITARGGGTSQAGQAIGAGVQLDFSKYLNCLLEFDAAGQWVRVEPGIVLDDLNAQLQPHGVHLPLDISTSDRATIGGMIANNSAGTRSVFYGKTLDYVLELTVALSDGSVVTLRPLDAPELAAKCDQEDLEGACYRVEAYVRTTPLQYARARMTACTSAIERAVSSRVS